VTIQTVERAIDVLECFSHQQPELTVGELSRRLGLHKSIVSRLVTTLREKRVLEQHPKTRVISIGVGAFRIGSLFTRQLPLKTASVSHLNSLVERIQHSCHVAVLDAHRLLTVASVETRQSLRVILRTGEYRYLHASAGGKLLLAYQSSLIDEVMETTGLPALTPKTITSLPKLRRELASIRDSGIAWNFEESTRGAGACAAPIFGAQGQIIGAITTVYPLSAIEKRDFTLIGTRVRAAAKLISGEMGWIDGAGRVRPDLVAIGARPAPRRRSTTAAAP
jgi:DNA-binding IclR family transcriptional regulator